MVKRGRDMVSSLNNNIIHPIEKETLGKNCNIGTFVKTDGGFIENKGKHTYLSVTRDAMLIYLGVNFNISNKAEIFLTGFFECGCGDCNLIGAYEIIRQGVKQK